MKNILYIVIIFWIVAFVSCEKDADLEIPGYSLKLAIHSFISPDDTLLKVHISTNRNVFGTKEDYPGSLSPEVILTDGNEELVFSKRDSLGFCSLKYTILPGREYKLLVKCEGYPDAYATCKVPLRKEISINVDTINKYYSYYYDSNYPPPPGSPEGYIEQKVIVKFTDIAGEKNYYNINATQTLEYLRGKRTEILMADEQDNNFSYELTKIVSDNSLDGKNISRTFQNHFSLDTALYSAILDAVVLETDAEYYKYHTSLQKYSGTDQPFTEYSPVYSNVSGGIGIFASYMKYKKSFKLK